MRHTRSSKGRHVTHGLKRNGNQRLLALAVAGAALGSMDNAAVNAATYTWSNRANDWNNGLNWGAASDTTAFPGKASVDVANFNSATTAGNGFGAPNLSASVTFTRMTFQSAATGGYAISADSGRTMTLIGTGTTTSSAINSAGASNSNSISAPVIFNAGSLQTVNTAGTLTFSGPITATANGLQFTSTGTVILQNSSNNFSGGLTIAGSKVNFANGALGASGNVAFSSGTLVYASGNTQDVSNRIGSSTGAIAIDTNGNAVTFSNSIANTNTGGLTVSSTTAGGSLTLASSNSYTGNTTVTSTGNLNLQNAGALSSGSLVFSGNGVFDNTAATALTMSNGLTLSGGSPTFTGTRDLTLNGSSSISGTAGTNRTITVTNAGATLKLGGNVSDGGGNLGLTKAGAGILTLSGSNTLGNGVNLTAGQLNINSAGALGAGAFALSASTTVDNTSGGAVSVANSGPATLNSFTFGGSNNLTFSGTGAMAVSVGKTLTLNGTGSTLTFGGAIQNTSGASSAPAIAVNGAGNTLVIGGANLSSATSPGLTFTGTANTNFLVNGTIANGAQSSGNIAIQNVTATFSGTNTYTGTTTVQTFSTLKLGSAHALGNTSSVSVTSSSKLDLNGWTLDTAVPITGTAGMAGNLTNSSATAASYSGDMNAGGLTTVDGVGDITLTGTIGGTGGGTGAITKNGNNKLTVTAANTYSSGSVTIAAGTLALSGAGSFNSSPTIVVGTAAGSTAKLDVTGVTGGVYNLASGQTLKGGGTVLGAISIGSGGTLAPGNSPGTLNTGDTTYAGGGSYIWEVNSATGTKGADPGYDWQNITGTLNITATSGNEFTIDVTSLMADNTPGDTTNFDGASSYTWILATASGGILGFDVSDFTIDTSAFSNLNSGTFAVQVTGNDLELVYTGAAVPEPGSLGMLSLGGLALLARRRRGAVVKSR